MTSEVLVAVEGADAPRVPSSCMTPAISPSSPLTPGAKALGALAVAGLVIAFSLSSTLAKRAETPGVLLAFWRMATVAIVWNVYLWSAGRHVTMTHLRQAAVPGVFLGLNLAAFFTGVTRNSVVNAALIGSLSPFLIVPLGARLFGEHHDRRALVLALVAFSGVGVVLADAPPLGDASLPGNVFGMLAMLLWVSYVVSTRHFRRDMDVSIFMATVTPIATLAVLPLAVAHGDMFGMSGTGWTYMLLLASLIGVAGHALMVFAQRTIQIGTIGIAQVVQPALAVVWAFLLLGERLRDWQLIGVATALSGLLAFLLLNQRGSGTPRTEEPAAGAR